MKELVNFAGHQLLFPGGGGGYSSEFLVGVCRPVPSNPDPISDQKKDFSTPVFRPGL